MQSLTSIYSYNLTRVSKVKLKANEISRFSLRTFFTDQRKFRNKNEIFNAEDRPDITMVESYRQKIKAGYRHPRSIPIISPSKEFDANVKKIFDKVYISQRDHLKRYVEAGNNLNKFIKHRKVPLEQSEIKARRSRIEDQLKAEFSLDHLDTTDQADPQVLKKLNKLEKDKGCRWAPIEFDETGSLTYLLSRSALDFASLVGIFSTIRQADPTFQPRTLFDFGSGLCCGLWAGREVFGQFTESFLVDKSKHMNDLARLILEAGSSNKSGSVVPSGLSFRLQLPSAITLKYDLVVSSNSLLELPSAQDRLSTLHSLWERVETGGYLVLADTGTNAGFHVIAEARDYLNQISRLASEQEEEEDGGPSLTGGHCVSPCPHDGLCPRHSLDSVPCNFPVRYKNFSFLELSGDDVLTESVSYLVFKKAVRSEQGLPRLLETPVRTKTSFYCRLCTASGTLQEVLARKKDDNDLFQLAKRLKWGDEMPVKLERVENRKKIGTPWMKYKQEL